jgi:hypothetical protein
MPIHNNQQIIINNYMGIQAGSINPIPTPGALGTRQVLDYKLAVIGVVVLEAANLNRAHGGLITNNSNCDVIVNFGDSLPALNLGMPMLPKLATTTGAVPSNIDVPEDYKGQIQLLFIDPKLVKPSGGVNLMEFIYIEPSAPAIVNAPI